MINFGFIDDLARRVAEAVPGAQEVRRDVEKNIKAMLHASFEKLDLVTREEFDVQAKVLSNTRAKLAELERQLAELEARLGKPGSA